MKLSKLLIVSLLLITLSGCNRVDSLNLHIISDVHYAPREYFEYVGKFKESNDANGTGKQIKYQEEIIDAYINEEIANNTKYIVITGDLVFSGSLKAHNAFAEKFHRLIDNGIKVLVIPGNHDFDYYPFTYNNDSIIYSNQIEAKDFKEIYQDYGYKDALSVDENSLSYLYKLSDSTCLLALDTLNKYGNVDGEISEDTLLWIDDQLDYADKHNMRVIAVGHHNLYTHNYLYDFGYRINNAEKIIDLFNKHNVKLYLSGHMHIQDILNTRYVTEVLNSSFTIYPHHYGDLTITNNEFYYESKKVDVEKYTDSSNFDLINYNTYGYDYTYNSFHQQIISRMDDLSSIDDITQKIIDDETILNAEYFMGIQDTNDYSYLSSPANSKLVSGYIKSILKYIGKNNTKVSGTIK